MGLLSTFRDKYITAPVVSKVSEEIAKAQQSDVLRQFSVPFNFNDNLFQKKKPQSSVTYQQLRNMADLYDIARACINVRKNQITQLNWDIIPIEDIPKDQYPAEIPVIRSFFATIGGYNNKFRKFTAKLVENYTVIDGVALEPRRTRSGALLGLIQGDPATIKIRVNEYGGTPTPPEIAYEQWINGAKVAEFTANELIYDCLNPRSDSPYGFSVMEALVMTVEEALRTRMYSLSYFSDGNTPEGFYELPENWSLDQIKSFQSHFNSLLSGDARQQSKIKFMPASGGKGYQPTKPFDFSGLQPYLEWLMQVTAALFGVMPQELGFTDDVNRANGQEQSEIAKRNSIKPMALAIEELFNQILWNERLALTNSSGKVVEEIGPFPQLQFKFLNLDTKDELIDSQITERYVKLGVISIDEVRKDKGLEPLGVGPYILTGTGPVLVSQLGAQNPEAEDNAENTASVEDQANALNSSPEQELKRWEKKALTDLKNNKPFRKFYSDILDTYTLVHLEHDLQKCSSRAEIKELFARYGQSLKDEVIHDVEELYKKLERLADA